MTRQDQKQEAITRMKMLKLHRNAIDEFDEEDKLNLSEKCGMLYWLNDEQQKMVKDFEEKNNAVVYLVIHDYTELGEMYSFLYVSDSPEEWDYDRYDLNNGYACAYVKNVNDDMCSEFGGIEIRPQFGGVVRTA